MSTGKEVASREARQTAIERRAQQTEAVLRPVVDIFSRTLTASH